MPQIRNSQLCESNISESGKMVKTPVICCMLGEYDPSYSCLFFGSYETVEMDFLL